MEGNMSVYVQAWRNVLALAEESKQMNEQTNKQTNNKQKKRRTTKTVSERTFQALIHVEAQN